MSVFSNALGFAYASEVNLTKLNEGINETKNTIVSMKKSIKDMNDNINLRLSSAELRRQQLDNLTEIRKMEALLRKFPFFPYISEEARKTKEIVPIRKEEIYNFNVKYYDECSEGIKKINESVNIFNDSFTKMVEEIGSYEEKYLEKKEIEKYVKSIKDKIKLISDIETARDNFEKQQKEYNESIEGLKLKEKNYNKTVTDLEKQLNNLMDSKIPEAQAKMKNVTEIYNNKLKELNILVKMIDDLNSKIKENNSNRVKLVEDRIYKTKEMLDKLNETGEIDGETYTKLREDIISNEEEFTNFLFKDYKSLLEAADKNLSEMSLDEKKQHFYMNNPSLFSSISNLNPYSSFNVDKGVILNKIVDDTNKILYTTNKSLNLSLFREIDDNDLVYSYPNVNNFKFSFSNESLNRNKSLDFKSNITRFTAIRGVDFNNFTFILSYNNIDTKDSEISIDDKRINSDLDSKSFSAGVGLKHYFIDNNTNNLFANIKLIYSFSKNKQNYFINNNDLSYFYNSDRFNSHQVALQTGFGTDLFMNQFLKLYTKVNINTIFMNTEKRNLNIEDYNKNFGSKNNTFVSLVPSVFLAFKDLYLENNVKLNFGASISYNKALSENKAKINNRDKLIDNDILGFGLTTNISIFNNVSFGLNYNLSKTEGSRIDNSFGINLNSGF